MSKNLTVSIIQTDLYWENSTANLAALEEKIATIETQPDLIVLPEMFSTGFTMNAQAVAEPMNHFVHKWLRQMAAQTNAVVVGSFICQENNQFYNRLMWVEPNGSSDYYDKRHLFRMAKENDVFTGGEKKMIKTLNGWKICPLICYDLRFPVWSRNQNLEYDLLIYIASWPQPRISAWDKLLMARAIENQSYVIGVNRVGVDGLGIQYVGHSCFVDFLGNAQFVEENTEAIVTQTLSIEDLVVYRTKFPAYQDADDFRLL